LLHRFVRVEEPDTTIKIPKNKFNNLAYMDFASGFGVQ